MIVGVEGTLNPIPKANKIGQRLDYSQFIDSRILNISQARGKPLVCHHKEMIRFNRPILNYISLVFKYHIVYI